MYDVQISIARNEEHDNYAMAVFSGPFKTKEEAEEFARRVKEFLEEEASAQISRVQ